MFRKRKQPWYCRVLAIFAVLRIIYEFARFFMKVVDKQAARAEKRLDRRETKMKQWF
jgi:hypothetical protein